MNQAAKWLRDFLLACLLVTMVVALLSPHLHSSAASAIIAGASAKPVIYGYDSAFNNASTRSLVDGASVDTSTRSVTRQLELVESVPSPSASVVAPQTALGSSTDLVRVADFADDAAAFSHYSKHVKGIELRPNGGYRLKPGGADLPELGSFGEYRNAARGFMGPDAPPGVLQGYRGTDLLRVDPKTGYFGVRSQEGVVRTFFRPDGDPVAYFWGQF